MSICEMTDLMRATVVLRNIDPDINLAQLQCLLVVSQEEKDGISITEIANKVGITLATASRYIAALGKTNRHHEDGFGLIETFEDPMERRRKIVRLTPKGKSLINKMLGVRYANISAR